MSKKRKKYPEMSALKGRIREMGVTYDEVAKDVGIATSSLSNKINGFYPMTADEMQRIATMLEIKPQDVARFFLPSYCRLQQRAN